MISAEIIADSVSPEGCRLTTFVLTYPRFIHCELMTHRVFSRNAASSRAIPVDKMIARVLAEPAEPSHWGKNQKGMQARTELDTAAADDAKCEWRLAMLDAVGHAFKLQRLGAHKQIINRLLEPFAHITTIVSATEFGNFFNLRVHPDAMPEFIELATLMLLHYQNSTPSLKQYHEWHLPFSCKYLHEEGLTESQLLKIATARCARVSYLNFQGDIDHDSDYRLHDDLLASGHMSPFEHVARPCPAQQSDSNFVGWQQYRKLQAAENKRDFDTSELLARVRTK